MMNDPGNARKLVAYKNALDEPILVLDFENITDLPSNFRTSNDSYEADDDSTPTRGGLELLNSSAARQFSELDLKTALTRMSGKICIVDLRQEPHGFLNGMPISWYGPRNQTYAHKSGKEIEDLEERLLSEIAATPIVELHEIVGKTAGRINDIISYKSTVKRPETERNLVERMGLKYERFFVTDHIHPNNQCIDRFLRFIETIDQDTWLHFHCRSGIGRASTFMVILDIVRNGHAVSLDDIVRRQALIGSKNLFRMAEAEDKLWRYQEGANRLAFIKAFYSYRRDPAGHGVRSWTEWTTYRGLEI